jgi:hypothetical protein
MKLYRVVDPSHVYSIYAVEVLAKDTDHAKQFALEAMMRCPLKYVAKNVFEESLAALTVEEMPHGAGRNEP